MRRRKFLKGNHSASKFWLCYKPPMGVACIAHVAFWSGLDLTACNTAIAARQVAAFPSLFLRTENHT